MSCNLSRRIWSNGRFEEIPDDWLGTTITRKTLEVASAGLEDWESV